MPCGCNAVGNDAPVVDATAVAKSHWPQLLGMFGVGVGIYALAFFLSKKYSGEQTDSFYT